MGRQEGNCPHYIVYARFDREEASQRCSGISNDILADEMRRSPEQVVAITAEERKTSTHKWQSRGKINISLCPLYRPLRAEFLRDPAPNWSCVLQKVFTQI